jgi:molybdenum cofactor cytidylyltransferase
MTGMCGVILAAGQSSRMGRDKALLPWPKVAAAPEGAGSTGTLLSSAIRALSQYSELVLVVAGHNGENIAPVIYAEGAFLVRNPAPERGQFSSLQAGLREILDRGRDNAVITLVDRPPPLNATLALLMDAFQNRPHGVWAVIPEYMGKHGHPIIVGREMIEELLRVPATSNAREVLHAHAPHIRYLQVADPLITTNVDTPEEYSSLRS